MNLEEIKNKYADSKGYNSWSDFIVQSANYDIDKAFNYIAIEAQRECLKLASGSANIQKYNSKKEEYSFVDGYYNGLGIAYTINKESITNENNIIK